MNSEELKNAKKILKELNGENWFDYTNNALSIIYSYQENDNFGYYVDDDFLEDGVLLEEAKQGVSRLIFFLRDASPNPLFGYRINAYGNLEDIDKENLIGKLGDIIEQEEEKNE